MKQTVDNRIKAGLNSEFIEQDDEVLERTRGQLEEYLDRDRKKVHRIFTP